MKYSCSLIAVSDMEKSKQFYHDVLGMNVVADFGANVKPLCHGHSYTKALLSIPSGNLENWSLRALNPSHSYTIAFERCTLTRLLRAFV